MLHRFEDPKFSSYFSVSTDFLQDRPFIDKKNLIHLHWNRSENPMVLRIDGIGHTLNPDQITTTTYFHKVAFTGKNPLTTFSFNREFYCIQDHDHEVSCNGILFFGAQQPPFVTLSAEEKRKYELLLRVFLDECSTRDNIQGEMLLMLLKRLIIKTTRLAKEQLVPKELEESQIDLVRKYHTLVDLHFREKKRVSDYAALLFRSSKTLSNLFAKYGQKTPLEIIHERIVLEGKRLLIYTDKSAKEIAIELGFEDPVSFHRLFRKVTGQTPKEFRDASQRPSATAS